jgi:four helix bundle protein
MARFERQGSVTVVRMTDRERRPHRVLSFRDLRVWQEAQILAQAARPLCDILHRTPYGDQADQLARAATSVHLNIAEGWGRFGAKDRLRFFDIAWSSLQEVDSLLEEAARGRRVSRGAVDVVRRHASNTGRLLAALCAALRNPRPEHRGDASTTPALSTPAVTTPAVREVRPSPSASPAP